MLALSACIQPLLRGHKYALFIKRGLCFGWGWNCYLLLEGFEDAPEGYSFRCNCFLKDWLELLLSLLTSSPNLSTNLPGQPENRSLRIKSSIFVVWELRDYNKILEKADMKRYWFWRLCVLYNWVKINTFSCRPFLRRRLLVATKITNIDDLILRLRLFTHPGKFLFNSTFLILRNTGQR